MRAVAAEAAADMHYLVGISGGLDSTLAAASLLEAGHRVSGAVLRFSDHTDLGSARVAASELGIPLHEIDCRERFEKVVKDYFAQSYFLGRTPNPCVVCNRHVKIALLCDLAKELGCDKVITGHYARIVTTEDGRYAVEMGKDRKKDQSYMLWGLSQEQLSLLEFPLADTKKDELRKKAEEQNFSAAKAGESMDICFLPDGNYAEFVQDRLGKSPEGNFVDKNGRVLGRHKGIVHYTVGQRKGLGIALGQPAFVSKIDPKANTVTLVFAGDEYADEMTVGHLNFQSVKDESALKNTPLFVKIRYAAPPVPCTVSFENDVAKVRFPTPVRAVTPGQSAVFYDENNTVVFGGFIV